VTRDSPKYPSVLAPGGCLRKERGGEDRDKFRISTPEISDALSNLDSTPIGYLHPQIMNPRVLYYNKKLVHSGGYNIKQVFFSSFVSRTFSLEKGAGVHYLVA